MQQTITETVSITPLDSRLSPTKASNAPYQLEIYHSKERPDTNIGVLNGHTMTYSYKIGDVVDVTPKVPVTNYTLLTNVVVNPFLQNYLQTR